MSKSIITSILILLASPATGKEADFAKHGVITALRKGDKTAVTITGIDGWKVNTQYNAKVTLGATTLRKADGIYKDINPKGDKACSVSWYSSAQEKKGTIKVVFCNDVSCTAPVSTEFNVR